MKKLFFVSVLFFSLVSKAESLPKEFNFRQNPAFLILRYPESKDPKSKNMDLVIPLFKDSDLKQPAGEIRIRNFQAPPDQEDVIMYRLNSKSTWLPFEGDYVPGGEWGYLYQTVLEKKGDLVLLPKKPFSSPVWFDFKKAFGVNFGENPQKFGPFFVFKNSELKENKKPLEVYRFKNSELEDNLQVKEFIPQRIDGKIAIIRSYTEKILPENEIWEEKYIRQLQKQGKDQKIPLQKFFDKDEHLIAIPQGGC